MALPTDALNETTPAGGAYVRDGNDRIIEYKIQVREILEIDHYFPSSGRNDACGRHKWVSLIETADVDLTATAPVLGAETADGKPELTYVGEDGPVKITKNGLLNLDNVTLASLAVLMAFVYPIGCIYTTIVATNPATVLGFGTWAAFGAGRVLVGLDAGQTEFDVVGETGGAKTHTLIEAEMPAHSHTAPSYSAGATGPYYSGSTGSLVTTLTTLSTTGGSGAHNNLQPYIVVYFWKRTA